MEAGFFLKKMITQLVLPPFCLLLFGVGSGWTLNKRWPRFIERCSGVPDEYFFASYARSFPACCEVIVCCGAVRSGLSQERSGDRRLGRPSAAKDTRIRRHSIIVYARSHSLWCRTGTTKRGLPVLVSGGALFGELPEATAMARTLKTSLVSRFAGKRTDRWIRKTT